MPHIMIVDDVATIRQIVSSVLGSVGYKIIEADSGEQAVVLAQTKRVHLVLADINMPGMSGLDLITKLRDIKTYRSTPIVILAKGGKDENIQKAGVLGANGWIEKPFTPDRLLSTVNQVLVDHYVH
ncbi:MAG TPA: response regulator [Burkholderiales bacterium]|nr:response regulator [Burkholderiales bacterium]